MKTTKHFALATLLVLGGTLFANTVDWAQIDLTPTGAEPGATGQVATSHVRFLGSVIPDPYAGLVYYNYKCTLSVTCQGLTPGATYSTGVGTFKASSDGTGSAKDAECHLTFVYDQYGNKLGGETLPVYRINADGSYTLVLWTAYPAYFY
jgi:hypothetical protein